LASFRIPYLVVKPLATGGYGYYWQPSPALAKKGWKGVNFGPAARDDDPDKMELARAKNREVDAWKTGGARPREIRRFVQQNTVAQLVEAYKDHCDARVAQGRLPKRDRNPTLGKPMAASTRAEYVSKLKIVLIWATDPRQKGGEGNMLLSAITPDRIAAFRDGLMKPDSKGDVMWNRAHGTLRVLRAMFAFAEKARIIAKGANPATDFDLQLPPARDQVWDVDGGQAEAESLAAACAFLGFPSVALAVEIAEWSSQRREDVLKFSKAQWRPITLNDRQLVDQLRGDDPDLKGFALTQGKTGTPLHIPIVGQLRRKIDAAITADNARATPALTVLVNEVTGRPWNKFTFSKKFAQARALAIAPTPEAMAKGVTACPSMAGKEFRDLRRTRVVRLAEMDIDAVGIHTITGHSIKTIEKMLEDVYLPRTTRLASITLLKAHGATPKKSDAKKQA
jgi:hypothetical protein